MPKRVLRYFVPNIWATIPLVGGTVESQSNPKVIPKNIEIYIEGGENIKIAMIIALEKYKMLSKIFLLYLVPK